MERAAQIARNESVSISTTSVQIMNQVPPGLKRIDFTINNTSSAAVATIAKGDQPAVAGAGLRLIVNAATWGSSDTGYECWQGAIQAVGDAAGTLAITETFQGH